MKKFMITTLSVILLLSLLLTACGTGGANETDESNSGESTSQTESVGKTEESSSEAESDSSERETKTEFDSTGESEDVTETESEVGNEVYTDLSAEFDPQIPNNTSMKAAATAEGAGLASSITISFDGNEDSYGFAPFNTEGGLHDAYSCNNCGYNEKNGSTAFHFCDDSGAHSGITIVLKAPINASIVSGLKATVMTADNVVNSSQLRIMKSTSTNASEVINLSGCPDISGATNSWKIIDFGFSASEIASLADADGYIRSFKFYFRDKDATELFIKSFTFTLSIDKLCRVNALAEPTFSRGDALEKIAQKIASNLENEGIGADIEIRCSEYVQNTSKAHGKLTYKAIITTESGKIALDPITAIIKKLEGEWLPGESTIYGTHHDSKEQWKTSFDKSGILFLEDNVLKAEESLARVEYAVFPKDDDVTSQSIDWYAPQILELNADGIDKLFINAYLDYGNRLTKGNEYRFVVRGVTENENYILHLDIPFTYSPLSEDAVKAIENATRAMIDAERTFILEEEGDKIAMIKEYIEKIVNNDSITVSISPIADGVNEGIFKYSFSYNKNVSSSRFPAYSLDGVERSDFYAYDSSFYSSRVFVYYDTLPDMDIDLLSPFDGEEDIRIASDEIVRFWDTDTDILVTDIYDYKLGELCDPKPVTLEWRSDIIGAFTVKVSEHEDLHDAWTFATKDEYIEVYNLKAGTRYYWRVENGETVSKTYTFVTEERYPRYILSNKVSNFRDIGGYVTLDGKRVKQGVAFRFSNFDSVSEADKIFINAFLGIRTELDLRGTNSISPLGSGVQAIPVSIQWYGGIFAEAQSEPLRKAIAVFADEANYPIGYHCAIGRDRTGTVTILLLGLVGVDEDTILKEYMVSKLSVSGGGDGVAAKTLYANYLGLINGLNNFGEPDDSLQDKIEVYLLSIGITEDEIASIRSNLLED